MKKLIFILLISGLSQLNLIAQKEVPAQPAIHTIKQCNCNGKIREVPSIVASEYPDLTCSQFCSLYRVNLVID